MSALTDLKSKIITLSQKMLSYNYKIDNGQSVYADDLSQAIEEYCESKSIEDNIATLDDIPTALSELSDDANHRLTTDAEKAIWNDNLDIEDFQNADTKDAIADTDVVNYQDSASLFGIVKTTWLNIKSKLKTYFDTIYASITHNHEPVQVTYAELYALKQSNNLTQNQLYEITDYRNRYQQAVSKEILTSEIEPLIIKAISHNSFSTKAYSKLYPQDEIYYNFENEMDENPILAPGADRGFIFRRIDTKQRNDFPFDFRNIKFRRWQVTGNEWDVATVYSSKSIVKRNGFLYIGVGNNNVGIDPELNNNTIATLDSYAWIKCNFADMSYVSDTPTGLIGTLQFAVTGLYQDYLMFSTEEIYSMSKNNIALYDWHPQSSHNDSHLFAAFNTVFKKESLDPSLTYAGVTNNQIGGDFFRNTILWDFSANKTSVTFYINLICDVFDNNLVHAHFRYNYFNKWVTHGTFTAWETIRSIFGDQLNASSFLCTGGFEDSIIAGVCKRVLSRGRVQNIIAHKNIEYSDFSGIMENVVFKKEIAYTKSHNSLSNSTINAKLYNVTFEGGITYLTTGEAEIKDVVFGKNIANADLTTLVYPTTHCRIETVEGTPDKLCIKYLNADGRQCYSIVGLDASVIETGVYETETNKEADIETYKESTTKYPTLKGLYDWAVAKFLLATKLVTSWSGTPSDENIPSEKLVYDELVYLDANKYDKNAADLLLGAKEDITNKSSNVDTDKTSTTKYANVKAIYDWAVGKFIDLTKIVTTWTATTLNTNVPSEKLVKDSLNLKADISPANGSTSALRALFTSVPNADCVYNTATGYYEMNGITNLTEQDVMRSYHVLPSYMSSSSTAYQGSNIRTNFHLGLRVNASVDGRAWCQGLTTLEVFRMHNGVFFNSTVLFFYRCSNLVKAETIRVGLISSAYNAENMFLGCEKLEIVYLRQLKVSISFSDCPLLSLESLQYIVTNRYNETNRITITVHSTVWSKLNDVDNYPEWNALLVDAVNNQYIDFAS